MLEWYERKIEVHKSDCVKKVELRRISSGARALRDNIIADIKMAYSKQSTKITIIGLDNSSENECVKKMLKHSSYQHF